MEKTTPKQARPPIPIPLQLAMFVRDRWLCYLCKRPLVFPLALRHLAERVAQDDPRRQLAYYNVNWRRDSAPLLDELGACIDHVEAYALGGPHGIENFAAVCARCNARKSTHSKSAFLDKSKPWKVKGKHGEPTAWDGMASVFVALAVHSTRALTPTERTWLTVLQEHFAGTAEP